jgi:hypothetical protein
MAQWMFSKPSVFLVIGRKNIHGCGSDIVMESISIIDSRGGRSAPPVNPLRSALAEVVLRRSPARKSKNASKSDVSGAWAHATCLCNRLRAKHKRAVANNDGTNEEPPTEFFGILICIR